MGKRGPVPLSQRTLAARGSKLAGRNPDAPQGPRGRPARPAWLGRRAYRYWEWTLGKLEKLGLCSTVDGEAIARYADCLARYAAVSATLEEEGETVKNERGRLSLHPLVAVANSLLIRIQRAEAEFGLTPAARGRLVVRGEDDEPTEDNLFKTG